MQPPPRPTIVPSLPIRSARQSRSSTAIAFAGSPGGTSWHAVSRSPSASCAATPWIPATFASATISTAPLPGTSSSSSSRAPILTSIPAAASTTPVGVVGMGVGDFLVDRQPRQVERVKRLLVDREGPPTLARPLPRGGRVDLEQHRERAPSECQPRRGRDHGAAAEGDHCRLGRLERRGGDRLLRDPESGFPVPREQLLDRRARPALDLLVEVDERPAEPARDLAPLRRLSRAHEAGEREMAVQGVRGHRMRST